VQLSLENPVLLAQEFGHVPLLLFEPSEECRDKEMQRNHGASLCQSLVDPVLRHNGPAAREAAYRFASLDYPATERRFNCYYAEFFPVAREKLRPHDHAGVEFIYVMDGILIIYMSGDEHTLDAGDSIYFDSTIPHAYRRSGGRKCSAVVITAA
jgi:quercetin dioxygenase-like cupin family protein